MPDLLNTRIYTLIPIYILTHQPATTNTFLQSTIELKKHEYILMYKNTRIHAFTKFFNTVSFEKVTLHRNTPVLVFLLPLETGQQVLTIEDA